LGSDHIDANTEMFQQTLHITTRGRGTHDITDAVQSAVTESGVRVGLCHVFVHHTSASLMLCENADPTVRSDLERFMSRLAPDGDPTFQHDAEGPDDMAAHVRTVLTQSGLTIPVTGHRCNLGTWQGVYLWEHRTSSHRRTVTVTITGG
jgi:secondary thiamine-phosphate synthase enzyme